MGVCLCDYHVLYLYVKIWFQDHIFEVEEISMVEGDLGLVGDGSRVTCPTLPVQSGSVEVGFDYDAAARKMTVHIIQVRGVPPKDIGGANNTQVDHLNLATKLANFTWMAEY